MQGAAVPQTSPPQAHIQNGQQKAPGHCDKAGRGQAVGVPGCTCVCHQLVRLFLSASGLGCQLLNLLPTDVPAAHSQGSLSLLPFLHPRDHHPQISSGDKTGHRSKAAR